MPLYCAVQWIATEGGVRMIDPEDEVVWQRAFNALLERAAEKDIQVIGVRDGEREPVLPHHFVDCPVSYPFLDNLDLEIRIRELHLCSYPYLDEERWRDGFDDSLRDHRGPRWSRLQVRKEDIRRFWPFGKEVTSKTGAPGRPSCMQYVLEEFERRVAGGQLDPSGVKRQADALREWVRHEHPHEKHPTVKTIANNIRHAYQMARNARN